MILLFAHVIEAYPHFNVRSNGGGRFEFGLVISISKSSLLGQRLPNRTLLEARPFPLQSRDRREIS